MKFLEFINSKCVLIWSATFDEYNGCSESHVGDCWNFAKLEKYRKTLYPTWIIDKDRARLESLSSNYPIKNILNIFIFYLNSFFRSLKGSFP